MAYSYDLEPYIIAAGGDLGAGHQHKMCLSLVPLLISFALLIRIKFESIFTSVAMQS